MQWCPMTLDNSAYEFGYDEDSRKAEKTHKACLKIAANMRRLLGEDFESFLNAER